MPTPICQTETVYVANKESNGNLADEKNTDPLCIESEMPSIIETNEITFVSAWLNHFKYNI